MVRKQRIFTLQGSSRNLRECWVTGLVKDGIEVREVPSRDLGDPHLADVANLFQAVHLYAAKNGFVSGFPTFHGSGEGFTRRHKIILLRPEVAEYAAIPLKTLHCQVENEPYDHALRAAYDWGRWHGRAALATVPTFLYQGEGAERTLGLTFLRPNIGAYTVMTGDDIAGQVVGDIGRLYAAANEWAARNGYATAIPNGHGVALSRAEAHFRFNGDFGIQNLVENEGWQVARIESLGTAVDGQGAVQWAAIVVLEKEG